MKDYRSYSYWLETCGDDLTPRPSLSGSIDVDVAILGAGFTGLWTAYHLLRREPGLSVAIIEAGIAGFGEDAIVVLPVDADRRIDVAAAREVLAAAAAEGREVFCIVASAGSTPTGAIDPLDALADLAAETGAWLHVDGAHAGAFLVSDVLRPRLAGIERADSLCLDAHKTLFVPAACTLLFYRDRSAADSAFAQAATNGTTSRPDAPRWWRPARCWASSRARASCSTTRPATACWGSSWA